MFIDCARFRAKGVRTPLSNTKSWSCWLVLVAYFLLASLKVFAVPFPTDFDELQHLSVVIAQQEHPDLFADQSQYFVLSDTDVTQWSREPNYINHPALYYLILSQFATRATPHIDLLRLINVFFACAGLTMAILGGRRLFLEPFDRIVFCTLAASFPRGVSIAAMINNDNLALFAGSMAFLGIVSPQRFAIWLLAGSLAIAGWTKLTALIALGATIGVWQAHRIFRGQVTLLSRHSALLIFGGMVGATPYLVSLVRHGLLLYVNEAHGFTPPALRASVTFPEFSWAFFKMFAMKWVSEGSYGAPAALALMTMLIFLTLTSLARWGEIRSIAGPFAAAFAITFAIHLLYGWHAYITRGDQTIAQIRYYNVLWPGIAAALAVSPAAVTEMIRGLRIWLAPSRSRSPP